MTADPLVGESDPKVRKGIVLKRTVAESDVDGWCGRIANKKVVEHASGRGA